MRRFRLGFTFGALAVALGANGCFIGVDDFSKTCTNNSTCPKAGGYICASTEKWPQTPCDVTEKGCLCEVKFPPDPYDAGSTGGGSGGGNATGGGTGGGGGVPVKDAGPAPDYCNEIRPVIAAKCLGTCHSSQMVYPNSPKDFRLDYYESKDGGLPGLKDKGPRVYSRALDNSMPPPVEQAVFPAYTLAEKAIFARWLDAGSPFGNGTCESPKPMDGGMDAGVDAGPQLSFAADIQPIFNTRCTVACHTAASPNGGLNLTTGNSHAALVAVNTSAGCAGGGQRVVAFDARASQLWKKLTPDGGYCLNTMPRNQMPLRAQFPAEFNKIEAWIAQGAKNN